MFLYLVIKRRRSAGDSRLGVAQRRLSHAVTWRTDTQLRVERHKAIKSTCA